MSTPFLSRRDIETWVPDATPPKDNVGFVATLSTSITKAIALLEVRLLEVQDGSSRTCHNESDRFLLWCQGLGVTVGRLDESLSGSKELRRQVLLLLLRLGTAIIQAISQGLGKSSQLKSHECNHLRAMLDVVETMIEESDQEWPDTPSGSEASDYGLAETMEEISVYIDCLLDLAPALDNPAQDERTHDLEEPPLDAKESFNVSCEEALVYCRKIRDRFDILPKYLVERLAEANVARAAEIRAMQSQTTTKQELSANDGITESLFSGKDPRLTETTKSSILPSSILSSALASSSKYVTSAEFDDNASAATFASFSTAASSIAMGRPRIPTMPVMQDDGFNCTVCLLRLSDVKTRKQWKRHVFSDLKPYLCTVEDCQSSHVLYSHSGMWAQHESSHPTARARSSECAFCSATYQVSGPAYYKHVSGHLREVSLSVLPRTTDDDESDVDVTDDTDSLPHHHDEAGNKENEPSELVPSFPREIGSAASARRSWDTNSEPDNDTGNQRPDATGTQIPLTSSSRPPAEVPAVPDEIDLNQIIDRLTEANLLDPGTRIHLLRSEILYLCIEAKRILLSQPILLELETPVKIVADIHGRFYDLLKIFSHCGFPPEANYIFLGNYVNHGDQSIEVFCLLLAYKIKYSENFFLLRGNNDAASVSRENGLYSEFLERYDILVWAEFVDVFDCLPLVAIVDEKIFCVHGGLSPNLRSMEQIRSIIRPTDIPVLGIIRDLLWSHPDKDIQGWNQSDHGVSFAFGSDVVSRFLQVHDMDLIVCGHQVAEDGYEFFPKRQLVMLQSVSNVGQYGEQAAVMSVDESLLCSFDQLNAIPATTKN